MAITQRQQKNVEGVPATACWNCKASVQGAHFCATCGKIQPLEKGADYFTFFELPRKLVIDPAALEGKFHTLSWKLHPDNFVRATEFERNLSLERSSELNDAFRTLREPVGRVEYLLDFLEVRKEGTTKQQAPPELLEEVFELNESLDELREARASGEDTAGLRERLSEAQLNFQKLLAEVDGELTSTSRKWDIAVDAHADDAARTVVLTKLGDLLNRRAYIRNLVAGVNQEMAT
jgi:molecular chaperone HscB